MRSSSAKRNFMILLILFSLKSSLIFSQEEKKDSTTFIEDVKKFSEKENIFSRLLKNILVFDELEETTTPENYSHLTKYSGKFIRKLNIVVLDVFGASIEDTSTAPTGWIKTTANSLHYKTRKWRIRNRLLFSAGERFYPFNASESERLLREYSFIYDAKVVPQEVSKDSIDVTVYAQDIWSINASAAYNSSENSGAFYIKDNNFIGLGSEFSYKFKFADHLPRGWTWDADFRMENINRSFFTGRIYHLTYEKDKIVGVSYNRDFYSPVARWAGGIEMNWVNTHPIIIVDTLQKPQTIFFNKQDLWLGYAFDFIPFSVDRVNQNRLNIALRTSSTLYTQKPEADSLQQFQNNLLYLFRIGFAERKYYKDNYIFELGKTEDIPAGSMFEFITGIENGEFRDVPYYGIRFGYSLFNKSKGYFHIGTQTGAFRDARGWRNGVIALDLLYFTRLITLGNVKWRNYFGNRYSYRYEPLTQGQLLNINGRNGLRGFSSNELGNRKLVLNYEGNIFLPIELAGFNLAVITFADFALLAHSNQKFFRSSLQQAYGIGLRFRNEHLIFPPVQFLFAYYPNANDPRSRNSHFFQQNEIYYQFNRFQFGKPELIEF